MFVCCAGSVGCCTLFVKRVTCQTDRLQGVAVVGSHGFGSGCLTDTWQLLQGVFVSTLCPAVLHFHHPTTLTSHLHTPTPLQDESVVDSEEVEEEEGSEDEGEEEEGMTWEELEEEARK